MLFPAASTHLPFLARTPALSTCQVPAIALLSRKDWRYRNEIILTIAPVETPYSMDAFSHIVGNVALTQLT